MSSYHGWTHAPKAQGGTDPIPTTGPIIGEAYKDANQVITSGNYTKLTSWDNWTIEDEDVVAQTANGLDIVVAGWYLLTATVGWNISPADSICVITIGINAVGQNITELHSEATTTPSSTHNRVCDIQYVEAGVELNLYVQHSAGVNRSVVWAVLKAMALQSAAPAPYWVPAQ